MSDERGGSGLASPVDPVRDKGLRLLRYLLEFVKMGLSVTHRVEDYRRDGFVLWFKDMPQANGCVSPLWAEQGEGRDGLWLEVHKQRLPTCPPLPESLKPWVAEEDIVRSDAGEPQLRPQCVAIRGRGEGAWASTSVAPGGILRLEEHPEVRRAWDSYLERWRSWAALHAERSSVQRLYAELFRAYQLQARMGEVYEFVVGLGLLSWDPPNGHDVRRHVIVAQAELRFDDRRGTVSVHCPPPPDGARLQIEDEFLEALDRPQRKHYAALETRLSEIGDEVWDDNMRVALEAWGTALHSDTTFVGELEPPGSPDSTPRLAFAPALIVRKRTARGTVVAYDKIIRGIEAGGPIPFGWRRLVEHLEDGAAGKGEPGSSVDPDLPTRSFFPLPTNDEQRRILEVLGRRQGVLVQGPPGTGKSHTIANLLCHFLALGKRVLVTSETPRALRVLKGKIPPEVRPLCVSLLGADTTSLSELESAISGIGRRQSEWNRATQERRIRRLESELDEKHAAISQLERELRECRESETHDITVGGGAYRGTAAAIGRRVSVERGQYGWLSLVHGEPAEPPLTNAEAQFVARTLGRITRERARELNSSRPPSDKLPSGEEFAARIRAESGTIARAATYKEHFNDPAFELACKVPAERRKTIREKLDVFLAKRKLLEGRPEKWLPMAVRDVLGGREAIWRDLAERTRTEIKGLREAAAKADSHKLRMPADLDRLSVLQDAKAMFESLRSGGRWTILWVPVGVARGKTYLRETVKVDGRPANSAPRLGTLVHRLETEQRVRGLLKRWKGICEPGEGRLDAQVAEVEENLRALELALDLLAAKRAVASPLEDAPVMESPDWASQRPAALRAVLQAVEVYLEAGAARAAVENPLRLLEQARARGDAHPVALALSDAIRERDAGAWSTKVHLLRELEMDAQDLGKAEELLRRLAGDAPEIARLLEANREDPGQEQRLGSFQEAWQWAAADRWLRERQGSEKQRRSVAKLEQLNDRLGELMGELAAEHAWSSFLTRLTASQRENLEAWQVTVRKIGKGTGKRAERYRAEARRYMTQCLDAIPAWIMPRYRVAELLEPNPECFDVVIVDEASQTGIDGLFLYYIGKQTIVVGDHQQISPYGVGVLEDAVADLQRHYLEGIPFPAVLGATSSLYDHAQIRFPGKVVLREHFRCMPEIIQFSNDLCYAPNGTALIPLRTYPPSRLQPVIARYVEDGYQEGTASSAVNRREASRLVDQLTACLNDERYAGKTFGVVSLLGSAQARLIQQLLTQRVGPEEMEARSLVCGDAYAFQGDERDVMFLSMVSAPNARIGALTGESAKQRFNVAASRARDQLWLHHSVKLEDLSPECMRRKLLQYCQNPTRRAVVEVADNFESRFEREVCERIRARGYRVRTQVAAGDQASHRYRIDLVIDGMSSQLAVECDGDEWHGPDMYEKDMARQRQLERAGWTFFRVAGGAFYADPEATLAPLWRELESMGIAGGGDTAHTEHILPPEATHDSLFDEAAGPPGEPPADDDDEPDESEPESEPQRVSAKSSCVLDEDDEGRESQIPKPSRPAKHRSRSVSAGKHRAAEAKPEAAVADAAYVDAIPPTEWFELAGWAKREGQLKGWQRGLAYSVGLYKSHRRPLTAKQYRHAAAAHREATTHGFTPTRSTQRNLWESADTSGPPH